MYVVKAFEGVGDNSPHEFSFGSARFTRTRFPKEGVIAFLDDLFTQYPANISLSIRLDNIHQLGDVENCYTDIILEVENEE